MPLEVKKELTEEQRRFGLMLHNHLWFAKFFWKEELTIPKDREDLPEEMLGQQIISIPQRMMMLDRSDKVLFCTGRKLGKSLILTSRVMREGVTYTENRPGEALLVTPRDYHLAPIRRRIEYKKDKTRFFKLAVKAFNKSEGYLEFHSGLTWWMRIEGQSSTGQSQVSLRARDIIVDEAAFGDDASHEARQQTLMPGDKQLMAGVPTGVRNTPFYRLDQTSEGDSWSRHKYPTYINPLYWSEEAKQAELDKHGSVNSQGYQTQILGKWGKEAFSSFPKIPYVSTLPFKYIELTEEIINDNLNYLPSLMPLPIEAVRNPQAWIMGGDLGYSPAPTVLMICYLKEGVWYEFARIKLLHTNPFNQARVIDVINCQLLPERLKVIVLDLHGWGSSVAQCLLHDPYVSSHDDYASKVVDANFAGRIDDPNILVHSKCHTRLRRVGTNWVCDHCGDVVWDQDEIRNARIPVKQHYTTLLKDALAYGQLFIDREN